MSYWWIIIIENVWTWSVVVWDDNSLNYSHIFLLSLCGFREIKWMVVDHSDNDFVVCNIFHEISLYCPWSFCANRLVYGLYFNYKIPLNPIWWFFNSLEISHRFMHRWDFHILLLTIFKFCLRFYHCGIELIGLVLDNIAFVFD